MACPVTCQRRSASTIMSGMAIPMTANTMWKARDTPICERAARRSDMKGKISGEVWEVRGGWWRLIAYGASSPNLLFQLSLPLLDRPIVGELSGHHLEDRLRGVRHAGGDERIGAEQPDPEPEEAAAGRGRERRQGCQGRLPVLLVHDQRF